MKNKQIHNRKFINIKRYMIFFLQGRKGITGIAFFAMMLVSAINLYKPKLIQILVDDAVLDNGNVNLLIQASMTYIGISLVAALIGISLECFYSKIKKTTSTKLKNKILKHISKMSGSYFSEKRTGNLIRVLDNDLYSVEDLGVDMFFNLIINIFTAIFSMFFLIRLQGTLFCIVVVLEVIMIAIQIKFTKIISQKINEIREIQGESSNMLVEYISNILNIVISKGKNLFFSKYLKNERADINKGIDIDINISLNRELSILISSVILITIYLVGGIEIINGKMRIGELIAFGQYTNMLLGPCMELISYNNTVQQISISMDRVYEVLDQEVDIKQNNNGLKDYYNFQGDIYFDNVSFTYDDSENVINNLQMSFKKNCVTGIVGNSGCGKSTITKLIYRLWNPIEGKILIDGNRIEDYNLSFLRNNISIVTQDVLLFDDTIINNITLNSKVSESKLKEVCEVVGIDSFVSSLDDGYNTIIGERGAKLSGGQKQRIAIARALLNKSQILIFDEATSALDNISQKNILKSIKPLIRDKTVIVIAHRLDTVIDADIIYVMNNGKVVEQGKHNELVESRGAYYNLLCGSIE